MTPAETYTKVQAYIYNRDVLSSNFRALFTLQFNQWAKQHRTANQLWPLPSIDKIKLALTEEEMYERNKKIIEQYTKDRLN